MVSANRGRRMPGWRAAAAAVVLAAAAACTPASAGSGTSAAHRMAFAPYVDTSVEPAFDLARTSRTAGVKEFVLGFVDASGGCVPAWGGRTALGADKVAGQIGALRDAGGEVRVSFGGQTGTELATACASADALTAAYRQVVDTYHADRVDFDIEGDAVADRAAGARRDEAVARLQKAHPDLDVTFTLPVETDGLDADALALLSDAVHHGVAIDEVNIMTMDYAPSRKGDMGDDAVRAATAAQRQLRGTLGLTAADAWKSLSLTPMIGANDVPGETFTLDDAKQLVAFATAKGVGGLSFWSAGRDRPCPAGAPAGPSPTCSSVAQQPLAFTRTFAAATS